MGNVWVRMNSGMQLWLINHSNCITKILLHILYSIDVLAYTIFGPLNFLERRSEIYGPNYAALGRIIVGEYDKCAKIIESPQRRGNFLGRAKLIPSRLPKYFPLFMSDADAGGDETHSLIHKYFWERLVPPAFERTSEPIFDGYVSNMVAQIKNKKGIQYISKKDLRALNRALVTKYVFHALFGLSLSEQQVKDVGTLFFGGSPFSAFVFGALKPWGAPFGCFQCTRNSLFSSLTSAIFDSPAMANYVASDATANISKRDFSEMLLCAAGLAGCLGTEALCYQVLSAIPMDYPINLNDQKEVMLAVLEAARVQSPVNNVNVILDKPLDLTINGRDYTLPPETVVAASIGLASVDPSKFENPNTFNPKRANIMSASLNFNHVGFDPVGAGTRQCPGRNIGVKLASKLLIELRKSYVPPSK